MTTTKTWLPVFSGFYSTIWDVNDSDFLDYNLKDEGLTKEEVNEAYRLKCYDEAYNEYRDSVVSNAVYFIERELSEYVTSIKLERLVSPREYNFQNDSINVAIELSDDNVATIKKYIENNSDKWQDYLTNHYTSRDGFWSSHSNDSSDNEWAVENAVKSEHNLGAILQFICENKGITEMNMYDYTDCHNMFLSGNEVREELLSDGWYDDKPEVLAEILESNYGPALTPQSNKMDNEIFVTRVLSERNIDGDEDATEAVKALSEKIRHIKELKANNLPLPFATAKGVQQC